MRRAVAAAALSLVAAVTAAPARAATPVTLAGTTTIVAASNTSTHLPVRVPSTVTIGGGYLDPPHVTITGSADVVMLYLVPARPRPLLTEPVMFGRMQPAVERHTVAGYPGGHPMIPAGDYDLVLLHTPGSAVVRLTLPSLHGSRTLRPVTASAARLASLADPGHGQVGWSGGAYDTLPRTGFVSVGAVIMATERGGVSHLTGCLKSPDDLTPAPADFMPECPGLRTLSFLAAQGTASFGQVTFLNYEAGRYGAGWGYEMAGLPTAVAGFATWVPV